MKTNSEKFLFYFFRAVYIDPYVKKNQTGLSVMEMGRGGDHDLGVPTPKVQIDLLNECLLNGGECEWGQEEGEGEVQQEDGQVGLHTELLRVRL